MDLVIRLRELRARAGLTQQQAAERSGIGMKTISSFESGSRIDAMKVSQLERLVTAYGGTLAYFFSDDFSAELLATTRATGASADPVPEDLPASFRTSIATFVGQLLESRLLAARQHRPSFSSQLHTR